MKPWLKSRKIGHQVKVVMSKLDHLVKSMSKLDHLVKSMSKLDHLVKSMSGDFQLLSSKRTSKVGHLVINRSFHQN